MKYRKLAADLRDPVAMVIFSGAGVLGSLGVIPKDFDPNILLEIVSFIMAVMAAIFAFLHHRDFKKAYAAGLELLNNQAAAPVHLDDRPTPIEDPPHVG